MHCWSCSDLLLCMSMGSESELMVYRLRRDKFVKQGRTCRLTSNLIKARECRDLWRSRLLAPRMTLPRSQALGTRYRKPKTGFFSHSRSRVQYCVCVDAMLVSSRLPMASSHNVIPSDRSRDSRRSRPIFWQIHGVLSHDVCLARIPIAPAGPRVPVSMTGHHSVSRG